MKRYKIRSMDSLEREMRAVARGERPAPADAAMPSFHSIEAVVRLLTPENRRLPGRRCLFSGSCCRRGRIVCNWRRNLSRRISSRLVLFLNFLIPRCGLRRLLLA